LNRTKCKISYSYLCEANTSIYIYISSISLENRILLNLLHKRKQMLHVRQIIQHMKLS